MPRNATTYSNVQFDVTVIGGTPGVDYDFVQEDLIRLARTGPSYLQDSLKKLIVKTSTPLTIKTRDSNTMTTNATIWVNPGVQANLTFDGVNIDSPVPCHIERNRNAAGDTIKPNTSLRITLAKGSKNKLTASVDRRAPGIHCGEGTELVIDDDIPNVTAAGDPIAMNPSKYPGRIPSGTSFVGNDGTTHTAGTSKGDDRLSLLESTEPGSLEVTGDMNHAAIGSVNFENAGTMTFNGGIITATTRGGGNDWGFGAAIGGGAAGSGGTMIFNGGTIETWTSYHGASIGGGAWASNQRVYTDSSYLFKDSIDNGIVMTAEGGPNTVAPESKTCAGDIYVNGGVLRPHGDAHGNAIGQGCCSWNKGHEIVIAGGTVLPDSSRAVEKGGDPRVKCVSMGIGAQDGAVHVIGGSVRIGHVDATNSDELFQVFINGKDSYDSAFGAYPVDTSKTDNPSVSMITIDLSGEVIKLDENKQPITAGDNLIIDWQVTVGGIPYEYGAPTRFTDGKLYLWLPPSAKSEQASVTLSYLDENGKVQHVNPLFRNPGQDDILKRYIDFDLPKDYTESLTKYYDGLPFTAYDISDPSKWITTKEETPKTLNDANAITYKYQRYTKIDGDPIHKEVAATPDGKPLTDMPSNVGVMKFTMLSKQYADPNSDDPVKQKFAQSYWGHRATGWCSINPIPSKVSKIEASWTNEGDAALKPGDQGHPSTQSITVSALIGRGETVDGKPLSNDGSNATSATCKAPQGCVQLYVDGKAIGKPIELLFDTKLNENGDVLTDKDNKPISDNADTANATIVPNASGGADTRFTYTFTPSDADWMVPSIGEAGKHEISLQFLPPTDAQQEAGVPANYLESAAPDEERDVPRAEVVIKPVEPEPTVTPVPDPDKKDPDFPEPDVKTGKGEHDDPSIPEDEPGDRTFHGSITTTWGEPSEANPHPGRVTLKVTTPSTAPIKVTDSQGNVFEADFVKDKNGQPVRNEDGSYTLVLDPTAVGEGKLTFKQEPNGAYTGSTWIYDVKVNPDASKAPSPKITKAVENLTHPEGPTQPGDRLRYTITASNSEAGSLWTDVVISDPLPKCLEVAEGTVALTRADGSRADLSPAAGTTASEGQYALSAPGKDGRRALTAPVGDIPGGKSAALTFECTVAVDTFHGATAADLDLSNIAKATGSRPDPADPDNPMPDPDNPDKPLPVEPDPTDPVTPPGPGSVVPGDPAKSDLTAEKGVANLTRDDGTTHVGDRLRYEIAVANKGGGTTALWDAVISDPLPKGIEPVPGTMKLMTPDGTEKAVPDAAYDKTKRIVAVTVGNLWGGQNAKLTFECTVGKEAMGANNANVGYLHGTPPSEDPERDPSNPGEDPGKPTDPPSGEPKAKTEPVEPPTVIPEDPSSDSVTVEKSVDNATRDDGTTHVGDTLRYTIKLANSEVGSGWIDAVIRDDIPEGLEPISGTIKLTLADGRELTVDDTAYDTKTRILAVTCGRLYGGQSLSLTFDALVTEEAPNADIGNVALGYGTPPSKYDPDAPESEPGLPFDPPGGWDAWERDHEKVMSEKVFPPKVTEDGGVVADDEDKKSANKQKGSTVKHKLAQTGDTVATVAGLGAIALLAAGAMGLASRRRRRCDR